MASAHLFGAAATPLGDALAEAAPTLVATRSERLEQAAEQALATARPGDAVLFSPAFASFDQFPNFRARALTFHDWLAAQHGRGDAPERAQSIPN